MTLWARRSGIGTYASPVLGVFIILVVWELLALYAFNGLRTVPTPPSVARQMWDDRSFYVPQVKATLNEAAFGWLWGNLTAIALAVSFVVVPFMESSILRLAVAAHCMPLIAVGPVLEIVLKGDQPQIVLAGLSVFFTTLVGTLLGLRSADRASLDVIRAYGGGGWSALVKVRAISSLPNLFNALKIAAPAAILGAMIGEYLGGSKGLGVVMVISEQALNVPRTWGIAMVAAALAGAGYILTALVGRLCTPWAPRTSRS